MAINRLRIFFINKKIIIENATKSQKHYGAQRIRYQQFILGETWCLCVLVAEIFFFKSLIVIL